MSPAHDLMERLAAADPVSDAATIGTAQQREADTLLERLLTTPVEGRATPVEEPRRRTGGRRLLQLVAATAVAAFAAFAALSLFDSDRGPTPNIVARAVAALTQDDAVYHAVLTAHARGSDVPKSRFTPLYETWHTNAGRMHSRVYLERNGRRGRVVEDFAGQRRPGRLGGPGLRWDSRTNEIYESGFGRNPGIPGAPTVDPFAPGTGLKELQAEGRLRVAGQVEVDGRKAYRLVSPTVRGTGQSRERSEIVVDAKTYLPRLQRLFVLAQDGSKLTIVWRYQLYETLPLNDRTSELLDFDPPAGAKCRPGTEHLIGKGSLGFPNPCGR